ncbi:MAG: hypothetical protein Q8O36_04425 [Candidatus Omnitrophota bacterium]|nr:hypothetical protein [Candidatus Omnitrophota bacterium]
MKISKLQLIVITVIILALIIAIILMGNRQPPKPKAIVPKYEVQTEEQILTGTGRFELPEEEYGQGKIMKEELIPEKAITELEAERQSKTTKEIALTATEQTGTQTKALESEKLQKKYPTPKKLREIKERGLVIY